MSSDIELVIAGRKPHRHIQSHADEHPWPLVTRTNPETCHAARLTLAQRVIDGKLPRAITVHWAAVSWCGAQGQDGFIGKTTLPVIHGRPRDAADLVTVRLWHEMPGGWQINGYNEFQPTNDEVTERSEHARKAAMMRWHPNGKL